IAANNLGDKVELAGTFCTGNCEKGVCVTRDDELFSVSPTTVDEFFNKEVLPKV
ncbi:MAG TPA: (2Fe-2S) ferredoxin domain-containing protein, partial [Candidatus Faecivivens stercoravium]|nr:(2Fe-2S) ferredoxin domain-containing protein [Candidatus Faecivivens stercoravium]